MWKVGSNLFPLGPKAPAPPNPFRAELTAKVAAAINFSFWREPCCILLVRFVCLLPCWSSGSQLTCHRSLILTPTPAFLGWRAHAEKGWKTFPRVAVWAERKLNLLLGSTKGETDVRLTRKAINLLHVAVSCAIPQVPRIIVRIDHRP